MLHKAIGRESIALFLTTTAIKHNQIARYVFEFFLGATFEFLPSSCAKARQTRRFSLLTFVFRHLMQGMNRNKDGISLLIGDFDDLLHRTICPRNTHQTGKLSYTMIHMHHIISWFKKHDFFKGQGNLGIARMVRAKGILMETIKYLVIGE